MPHIPFNKPFVSGEEITFINDALRKQEFSGDGYFTRECEKSIETITNCTKVLMTSSCTHALEMCAILADIQEGDEVIMSSFNFVSAANAFVLRGARIKYVDIRPDTMNIDENLIESAITPRTKAILVMHYGAIACAMDKIMAIAIKHKLLVIEDAAHCIDAYYDDKHLGTIGDLGTLSFHATKNIHCGEGGALLINNPKFINRAQIIREKGTNRQAFIEGLVDKYSWVDIGSSYLMSEISAAFLLAQLNHVSKVTNNRVGIYQQYEDLLQHMSKDDRIEYTSKATYQHNGHNVYIKCDSERSRNELIRFLRKHKISAFFHYVPLHSSLAGQKFGKFIGTDIYTTKESGRLLRLPLFYDLDAVETVVSKVEDFLDSYES